MRSGREKLMLHHMPRTKIIMIYTNYPSSHKIMFCDHLLRFKFAQGSQKRHVVCVKCNYSVETK